MVLSPLEVSQLMMLYHICSRNGRHGSARGRRRRKWHSEAVRGQRNGLGHSSQSLVLWGLWKVSAWVELSRAEVGAWGLASSSRTHSQKSADLRTILHSSPVM